MKEIKENYGGLISSMTYLLHCKNFCGCYNVTLLSTAIKQRKERSILDSELRQSIPHSRSDGFGRLTILRY
jgi:hypothetical protein